MAYPGTNQRTIQQMQRVGRGFIERHLRNQQVKIQREQEQAQRAGVSDVYQRYMQTLSGEQPLDDKARVDTILKTIGDLQQFPDYGQEAINQIIQAETLRSKYKEDRPNTIEEGLIRGDITKEQAGEYSDALGKQKGKADKDETVDEFISNKGQKVLLFRTPDNQTYYTINGVRYDELPAGITVRDSSGSGDNESLKQVGGFTTRDDNGRLIIRPDVELRVGDTMKLHGQLVDDQRQIQARLDRAEEEEGSWKFELDEAKEDLKSTPNDDGAKVRVREAEKEHARAKKAADQLRRDADDMNALLESTRTYEKPGANGKKPKGKRGGGSDAL